MPAWSRRRLKFVQTQLGYEARTGMDLEEFALIPDGRSGRGMLVNPPEGMADEQSYGCGCFWFRKPR